MSISERVRRYEDLKDSYLHSEGWKDTIEWAQDAEKRGLSSISIITKSPIQYSAVLALLDSELWRLHPMMTTGRPYSEPTGGHVWLLTNIFEVPDYDGSDYVFDRKDPSNWADVQPLHPVKDADKIKELKEKGYEYKGERKDEVTLVLYHQAPKIPMNLQKPEEDLEQLLAQVIGAPVNITYGIDPPDTAHEDEVDVWMKPDGSMYEIDFESMSVVPLSQEVITRLQLLSKIKKDLKVHIIDHSEEDHDE